VGKCALREGIVADIVSKGLLRGLSPQRAQLANLVPQIVFDDNVLPSIDAAR
jgi:hypothetical protein